MISLPSASSPGAAATSELGGRRCRSSPLAPCDCFEERGDHHVMTRMPGVSDTIKPLMDSTNSMGEFSESSCKTMQVSRRDVNHFAAPTSATVQQHV